MGYRLGFSSWDGHTAMLSCLVRRCCWNKLSALIVACLWRFRGHRCSSEVRSYSNSLLPSPMGFEVPTPNMTFDVALDDGAQIRMRRHGNPDGVRLLMTHGNGFAADAYFPYWQHLLPQFDLLVFDFRNHGQNVPVVPSHHTYEQLTHDLERVVRAVKSRLGEKRTAGLFHSMSARTAMKHAIEVGWCWDALVLFDPPNVPPPGHPLYATMEMFEKRLTEWALQRRRLFAAIG